MRLYASNPDLLANQQFAYDNYYLGAKQSDRAAYDAAQARALQAMLQQNSEAAQLQEQDIGRQANANESQLSREAAARENDANRNFTSTENALNRNYTTTEKNDSDQDRIFNEATRVVDWLPTDPVKLRQLYPTLSIDRIQKLALFAGQSKVDSDRTKFQSFVTQGSRMAATGDVPTADTAASFGLQPGDPRVSAILKTWQQPYVDQYHQAAGIARAGNLLPKIARDQTDYVKVPIPAPTTTLGKVNRLVNPFAPLAEAAGAYWTSGLGKHGITPENTVQPNPEAVARMTKLSTDIAPYVNPNSKQSMVTIDAETGQLVPNVPRPAWMNPSPAPNQFTANGYQIGKVYSGLRFLGGDPNNESSWQKIAR